MEQFSIITDRNDSDIVLRKQAVSSNVPDKKATYTRYKWNFSIDTEEDAEVVLKIDETNYLNLVTGTQNYGARRQLLVKQLIALTHVAFSRGCLDRFIPVQLVPLPTGLCLGAFQLWVKSNMCSLTLSVNILRDRLLDLYPAVITEQ